MSDEQNTHVEGDRDPVAFVTRSSSLESLPKGRVSSIQAFATPTHLVVHVTGVTAGYGGRLIVEKRPERIRPTLFHVHEKRGNDGINPDASPDARPTSNVYYFDAAGIEDSILVETSEGRQTIEVVKADEGAIG